MIEEQRKWEEMAEIVKVKVDGKKDVTGGKKGVWEREGSVRREGKSVRGSVRMEGGSMDSGHSPPPLPAMCH
jgi:hypothetical protein